MITRNSHIYSILKETKKINFCLKKEYSLSKQQSMQTIIEMKFTYRKESLAFCYTMNTMVKMSNIKNNPNQVFFIALPLRLIQLYFQHTH